MRLKSYAAGQWVEGAGRAVTLANAITGEPVAEIDSTGLDFAAMLDHARRAGGPALRKLTFHQRALRLKELAAYLMERKEEFYELSKATGATRTDAWIDVEGGIGTLFAYASKGRRELPNATFYLDGPPRFSRAAAPSWASTSACRSRGPRCTSTPTISLAGACSRSWARRSSPGCPRSSSRRAKRLTWPS
jgi:acyl-CoA reductase-like NAD-dependent aldehyde dehydrogenase